MVQQFRQTLDCLLGTVCFIADLLERLKEYRKIHRRLALRKCRFKDLLSLGPA
jgi:hypothetical protein